MNEPYQSIGYVSVCGSGPRNVDERGTKYRFETIDRSSSSSLVSALPRYQGRRVYVLVVPIHALGNGWSTWHYSGGDRRMLR